MFSDVSGRASRQVYTVCRIDNHSKSRGFSRISVPCVLLVIFETRIRNGVPGSSGRTTVSAAVGTLWVHLTVPGPYWIRDSIIPDQTYQAYQTYSGGITAPELSYPFSRLPAYASANLPIWDRMGWTDLCTVGWCWKREFQESHEGYEVAVLLYFLSFYFIFSFSGLTHSYDVNTVAGRVESFIQLISKLGPRKVDKFPYRIHPGTNNASSNTTPDFALALGNDLQLQ